MQRHCKSCFRNLFRNHCSCIWIITETPASPTSYYFKHSNSCHASKRFAAVTLESGGSRAEPELESGSWTAHCAACTDLIRLAILFGPCAVSCQMFQWRRNSLKSSIFGPSLTFSGTQWISAPKAGSVCSDVLKSGAGLLFWLWMKKGPRFLFISSNEKLMKLLSHH